MGLDQYIYTDDLDIDTSKGTIEPRLTEIAYFRKNYAINDYIEDTYQYRQKGHYGDTIEITLEDAIAMCRLDEDAELTPEEWGNIFIYLCKNRPVYYGADW